MVTETDWQGIAFRNAQILLKVSTGLLWFLRWLMGNCLALCTTLCSEGLASWAKLTCPKDSLLYRLQDIKLRVVKPY